MKLVSDAQILHTTKTLSQNYYLSNSVCSCTEIVKVKEPKKHHIDYGHLDGHIEFMQNCPLVALKERKNFRINEQFIIDDFFKVNDSLHS